MESDFCAGCTYNVYGCCDENCPGYYEHYGYKRVLVWFSCGAASAIAADIALDKNRTKYPGVPQEVLYCDTLKYEHPDNVRFIYDFERWQQWQITKLKSDQYDDIFDVFNKSGWLVGPGGAKCTTALKRDPRTRYQQRGDVHVFGYTAEEEDRAKNMEDANPHLKFYWPLIENGITKRQCKEMLLEAGIELPMMYRLGYKNNNCIGCVKGGMGYWNKIRVDFPEAFERMAKQERKMNVAICKSYKGDGKRKRVFLDELDPSAGRYKEEPDISCGPQCLR